MLSHIPSVPPNPCEMNNRRRRQTNRRSNGNNNSNRAPRTGPVRASQVSHQDLAINRKTLMMYGKLAVANSVSGLAYGIGRFKYTADNSQTFAHNYMTEMSDQYEQYRVRRIRIFGMPGAHMTNDIRLRTEILCRVDPDSFNSGSTAQNLGLLAASSNTVTKRLNDSPNGTLLCDYNPICHPYEAGASQSDGRVLANNLTWMMLRDTNSTKRFHLDEWKGAQMAITVPDESWDYYPAMQLRFRIDLEFRGRQVHNATYSVLNLTEPKPAELEESLADLKNSLLTGLYHPVDFTGINVANIGFSVFGPDLIDCKFRINATSIYYVIVGGDNTDYEANSYTP